jgi:hypothetical protein
MTIAVELVLAVATILLVLVLTAHAAAPGGTCSDHVGATTIALAITAMGSACIGYFVCSLLVVGGRS